MLLTSVVWLLCNYRYIFYTKPIFFHISFTLENDNTILWWICIVHLHCQCEWGVIHTKIVYMFSANICISHHKFSVSFRFPFRSVLLTIPFSIPHFSNTLFSSNIHSNASNSILVCHLILKNGTYIFVQTTKHICLCVLLICKTSPLYKKYQVNIIWRK